MCASRTLKTVLPKPSYWLLILLFCFVSNAASQVITKTQEAQIEKLFAEGNQLMEAGKPAAALKKYDEILRIAPDERASLYNGGMAAFQISEFGKAAVNWSRLKKLEPLDWQVRSKLVQAYQGQGDLEKRDQEIAELYDTRKAGGIAELSKAEFFVREQTVVSGKRLMVFEHFELKGPRGVKFVFYVLGDDGKPEYRISLGSYDTTDAIWRETTKPKPKKDVRLYHLDGYYEWGHATHGMFVGQPSYDSIRKSVVEIVLGKSRPLSKSVVRSKEGEEKKEEPAAKPPLK